VGRSVDLFDVVVPSNGENFHAAERHARDDADVDRVRTPRSATRRGAGPNRRQLRLDRRSDLTRPHFFDVDWTVTSLPIMDVPRYRCRALRIVSV
jgi:hypothetical protein